MGTPLRVLILEDHVEDAELLAGELRRCGFDLQWKQAACEQEFLDSLSETWDLVLADFSLPQYNALQALKALRERGSTIQLVVVTGSVGEETAVECIKQGAVDYLLKDRLARLGSSVRQALEQKRVREENAAAHRTQQENEQRFRALIEHSSNGTLLVDASGTVIHRYNDLLAGDGYECENFLEWMVAEDRSAVRQMWDRLSESIQTIQFRISNANGTVRWLEAVCNDLTGLPCVQAIVVHYCDVTERSELEAQFRQAQKMEAVGQLAAGLGHDFNNLLTIISGYSHLSMRNPGLPEPVQKGLAEIKDACDRATRLTGKLLTFSGKQDSRPVVLDANRAISHLAPLLRSLLGEDIVLQLNQQDELGRMKVDEGELGQLIMNLVVNARDSMPGSGTVTIETRNVQHRHPLSKADAVPGEVPHVMLSVRDTGCGMDHALQSRIFEPFFTTKDVGKGTGLGLSTVYAITTKAAGQVSVESTVGEGSTFRLFFPQAQGPAAADQVDSPQPAQATARETILLVEDDDRVRNLIVAILHPLGYRLIPAPNAADALHSWRSAQEPIHLLLTDIRMPGMKGTELAQLLRKEQPTLKVLFMSGQTGAEMPGDWKTLQGACLLAKPFSPTALAQKVREVLVK